MWVEQTQHYVVMNSLVQMVSACGARRAGDIRPIWLIRRFSPAKNPNCSESSTVPPWKFLGRLLWLPAQPAVLVALWLNDSMLKVPRQWPYSTVTQPVLMWWRRS